MSLDFNVEINDEENICSNSILKYKLLFSNKSEEDIFIDSVDSIFTNTCAINSLNLKRYNKITEINRCLSLIENFYSNINEEKVSCKLFDGSTNVNQFDLITLKKNIFQHKILSNSNKYEINCKLKLQFDTISTYRSKYIHFFSHLIVKVSLSTGENLEVTKPIVIKYFSDDQLSPKLLKKSHNSISNSSLSGKLNGISESVFDDENTENSDCDSPTNPFEHPTKDPEDEIISVPYYLENRTSLNYKISYKDENLCFLIIDKSPLIIGEDIRILVTFIEESPMRCVKLSVSLRSSENLILPIKSPDEPQLLPVATHDFDPYVFDSLHLSSMPFSLTIPHNNYPTIKHIIFLHSWSLHFSFLVANKQHTDPTQINSNSSAPDETPDKDKSWSIQLDQNCETLNWVLPIQVVVPSSKQTSRFCFQ